MSLTRSVYQLPRPINRTVRNTQKRLRDYEQEDARQVARGRFDLYIQPDLFTQPEHDGAKHRPYQYPDAIFQLAIILRQLHQNAYRTLEGELQAIANLIGYQGPMPDHVTIWKRVTRLGLPSLPRLEGRRIIILDSTGIHILGPGEWRAARDHERIERTYLKLHTARDATTGLILDWALTNRDGYGTGDSLVGEWLITSLIQDGIVIKQCIADGAYDNQAIRKRVSDQGGSCLIPPREDAAYSWARDRYRQRESWEIERDEQIEACRQADDGRARWKNESGYHQRSLIETTYSCWKRLYGPGLTAFLPEQQRYETAYRVWLYNQQVSRSIA